MARAGRAASAVAHKLGPLEENFIWKEANKIFRPRYSKAASRARRAEAAKGHHVPDGRAGSPAHRSYDRVSVDQQAKLAHELEYRPYRGPNNARQPVFHNPDKEPPYISYDRDGHGAVDRTGSGLPPNVPWKGASNPRGFRGDRLGTYVPKYDEHGNIIFDRVRD